MSQIKLDVRMALLTYFCVVRSPRDGIELVANDMMCQSPQKTQFHFPGATAGAHLPLGKDWL